MHVYLSYDEAVHQRALVCSQLFTENEKDTLQFNQGHHHHRGNPLVLGVYHTPNEFITHKMNL